MTTSFGLVIKTRRLPGITTDDLAIEVVLLANKLYLPIELELSPGVHVIVEPTEPSTTRTTHCINVAGQIRAMTNISR
jgi:hypothetical protein